MASFFEKKCKKKLKKKKKFFYKEGFTRESIGIMAVCNLVYIKEKQFYFEIFWRKVFVDRKT